MLHVEFKRLIHSWKFWVAFLGGLAILLHPLRSIYGTWSRYSPMQLLSFPLGSSDFSPYAALFCTLPFSDSFCEDCKQRYVFFITSRIGTKKYAFIRTMAVALSGGITMGSIMLFTILICFFLSGQPETAETLQFLRNTMWAQEGLLTCCYGYGIYGLRVFVSFLFGMVWALIGHLVSVVTINQYASILVPFVLYQALWFLLSGSAYNPVYMFRGDSGFIPSFTFLLIYQVSIIIITAILSYIGVRRRSIS